MSRRAALVLCCLLGGLSHALADDPPPTQPAVQPALPAQLLSRLRTLEGRTALDAHAKAALEQAKRAMEQAEQAARQGDAETEARAARVAEAALSLAERLHALAEERALGRAASERTAMAVTRRKAAEAALAKERARLSELNAGAAAQAAP